MTGEEEVNFLRLPQDPAKQTSHFIGNENEILQDDNSELAVKIVFTHRYPSIPDTMRKKAESTWCQLLEGWHQIRVEECL